MIEKNKCSVIMATYNGFKFIKNQLDSLINQSLSNIEIIIQDDCSTDHTWKILQEYSKNYSNLSIYRNKENLGITENFLSLLEKASGDYIAICDQDDIWEPHKVETLISEIEGNSLVYAASQIIDENGQDLGHTLIQKLGITPKEGKILLDLHISNSISGHACLFTKDLRDVILKNRDLFSEYGVVYDILFGMIASLYGSVKYVDQPLVKHRIHATNSTNIFSGKKKKKGCFLERRKKRVLAKVREYQLRAELLDRFYGYLDEDIMGAFERKQARKCLFDLTLYRDLQKTNFPKAYLWKVCLGQWYFWLFKWL